MTATQLQQHTLAIADQINSHAKQATTKASEAVQHAIEAGKLLIEVKASLAHGQFGAWLESNVTVTARQARRYIAAAEGKPSPIRAISAIKSDTVSVLTHDDVVPILTPEEEAHETDVRIGLEFKEWWEKQKAATARGEGSVPLGPLGAAQYAAHIAECVRPNCACRPSPERAYFAEGAHC